jgi:alpha-glucosidase
MLALYRAGLRLRRAAPWDDDGTLRWLPAPEPVLAFARGEHFACVVNFGAESFELPAGSEVLIASNELEGGALPPDTTVWLRQAKGQAPSGHGSPGAEHSVEQVKEREGR